MGVDFRRPLGNAGKPVGGGQTDELGGLSHPCSDVAAPLPSEHGTYMLSDTQVYAPQVVSVIEHVLRGRANMAHSRQSSPDSGLGFQVKVIYTLQVVISSLGSGWGCTAPGRGGV